MKRSDPASRLAGATVPSHMAVIPDGNRRWAREHGLPVIEGHRRGFSVARKLARFCRRIGVHTTTVWTFSTENWRRSPAEIAALMKLYETWIKDLMGEAIREGVRVVHLGRKDGLPDGVEAEAEAAGFADGMPKTLRLALDEIEERTAGGERNVINVALNYGGADEIQRAVERLLEDAQLTGGVPDPRRVESFLDTAGQPHPNPDMVWRTSGEHRSSGFLPLQSAYAELVFTPKYFPDLTRDDLVDAVLEYSSRRRRFGG